MEIPVIHEKTSRVSSTKQPSTSSLFHNRKDNSRNASLPSSSTPYGYSRSFPSPFTSPSSSIVDKHSHDCTTDHLFSRNLTNQDSDFDHMTLNEFNPNSDNFMTMMMTNDDLSSFHSNVLNNNNNTEPQGFRSLHTRLPSTDSGIQADAGFDSLSRYKGKHLLSSTNAAAVAAAAAFNPANGTKLSDNATAGTPFNQHTPSPTSLAMTSPNDSNTDSHTSLSPQEISSSGYGSDFGVSSPSSVFSSSSPSSFSPPASSSPSTPVSISSALPSASWKSGSLPVSGQPGLNPKSTPTKPVLGGHRTSGPAVAPKPRVSLSRKPAFLGRGASTVKPPVYSGGGGSVNNNDESKIIPESLSLSSGIKVIKKEDGVDVCINTKPASTPKNSEYNKENDTESSNHSFQGPSSHGRLNDSHNSSIDILSPDGSSVKIQVVKSGPPSVSSSSSSSLKSSSLSSSITSSSNMNTHPQSTIAGQSKQTTTTVQDSDLHLTRPLRLPVSDTAVHTPTADSLSPTLPTSSVNTSPTNPMPASTSPTSIKTPVPKWRSNTSTTSIHTPLISSCNPSTTTNLHHPSERQSSSDSRSANIKNKMNSFSKQNQPSSHSEKQDHSSAKDPQKTIHHIPIKTINVSHSVPKTLPNSPLYTNVRNGVSENSSRPILDYSKTTPISVITNTTRSNDRKQYTSPIGKSFTTSPSPVISSPPPTIVMSPAPSPSQSSPSSSSSSPFLSSISKKQTPSPVIDSCIFRFKSPETSVFKQTFYDNNKSTQSSPSPSSSPQQQQRQQNQNQKQQTQSQLLRPTYLPTSNRTDFLKKKLKSSHNNGKTSGTAHPDVVLRRTDDIIKEALDFFNSRDDDDWDKLFSKSSFFDEGDDDMEKIFSRCWKTQNHDEFDKLFSKVFKRRKGSLDVDTRLGVSVDEDNDDDQKDKIGVGSSSRNSKFSNRGGLYSHDDKTTQSKSDDRLGNAKPRDMTSPNSEKDGKGAGGKSKEFESGRRSSSSSESWKETKQRMDSALSWLQHELADLRAMDKSIVNQFRRCQDTIESLQAQREVWEGLEEETEFWDDMEISEFNRRCQESPGSSSLSPVSTGSRDVSMATSDSIWNAMRNGGSVIQDVEATL